MWNKIKSISPTELGPRRNIIHITYNVQNAPLCVSIQFRLVFYLLMWLDETKIMSLNCPRGKFNLHKIFKNKIKVICHYTQKEKLNQLSTACLHGIFPTVLTMLPDRETNPCWIPIGVSPSLSSPRKKSGRKRTPNLPLVNYSNKNYGIIIFSSIFKSEHPKTEGTIKKANK